MLTSPLVLDPLGSLLGPNIELVLNRHNHLTVSAAQTSSARLHRDVLQWSRPIVTVIAYLEKSDESSGCTHIIPTSHLLPFVGTPNNGGTWMDDHHVFAELMSQALPVPMEAGGILAFDGLAFHAAGHEAEKTRLAVSGAFHSVDELKAMSDPDVSVLVAGEQLYRGGRS
jgi:phytanoyl-CoA hydroxylase